ncbi:MAG: DUF3087 family protein [Oceanospirillaceae bacterium]|nr:DUF3087 family protein [Oceanospirillaceae bacterium]
MSFKSIEKVRYGRQLKVIFYSICVYMLTVALGISTLLIYLFDYNQGENFWLNVAGVVIAAIGLYFIYQRLKGHPYLSDIIYIRAIKAQLNHIYRKQNKLKKAAQQGDAIAMAILNYSYKASRFVYELDDNTLTIEELDAAQTELSCWLKQYDIAVLVTYKQALLQSY